MAWFSSESSWNSRSVGRLERSFRLKNSRNSDGLAIGDDGQRLQRRAGEPLGLDLEEAADELAG
jgi:hypothetical protein